MDEQKKTCENCGNFTAHYSVFYGRLNYLGGHCSLTSRKGPVKFTREQKVDCEFWKPKEERVEREKDSIRKAIRSMEKHLNEISLILKNDIL